MRRFVWALAALACLVFGGEVAQASVQVHIDIARQRMVVRENGSVIGTWAVSTARSGKITPTGSFRPYTLRRHHFSTLYRGAPMPYSIFFRGNYAIHGTNQVGRLGRPASAGCIRLHPGNAARLFALVQRHGMSRTRITIARGGGAVAGEMQERTGVAVAALDQQPAATGAAPTPRGDLAATRSEPIVATLRGSLPPADATPAPDASTTTLVASADAPSSSATGTTGGAPIRGALLL
jgi:hypothetical protein